MSAAFAPPEVHPYYKLSPIKRHQWPPAKALRHLIYTRILANSLITLNVVLQLHAAEVASRNGKYHRTPQLRRNLTGYLDREASRATCGAK